MSNKRKDMWKLLYNLVKRSETELSEVFGFVDDILCKEPSLIRAYSLRDANNRFQDTFIVWLINKFVKCLEEIKDADTHQQSIDLQKKILTSCFVNRSVLFEHLVSIYTKGIEQLSLQLINVEWQAINDDDEGLLELTAFSSSDTCLCEIDAEFEFPLISINLDNADARICDLLQVLQHALAIGFDVYSNNFVCSLECVLLAVKECDVQTKLKCMNYCLCVFEAAHTITPMLEQYYLMTLNALAIMWELVPVWLHADCLQNEDVEQLKKLTCAMMNAQKLQLKQMEQLQPIFEQSFDTLQHIVELKRIKNQSNFEEVIQQSALFMLHLLLDLRNAVTLNEQQRLLLWQLADENAILLRPYVASLVHTQDAILIINLNELKQKFTDLLGQHKTWTKLNLLLIEELLKAVIFLEEYQHQQLQSQAANIAETKEQADKKPYTLQFVNETPNLQDFLAKAEQMNTNFEHYTSCIKIATLLLQSEALTRAIPSKVLVDLLNFIEQPLKAALASHATFSTNEYALAKLSLESLCSIYISEAEHPNVCKHYKLMVSTLSNKLFSSSFHSSSLCFELRAAFVEQIDQLVALGIISAQHVMQNLALNLQDIGLLAKLLRPLYCTSNLSSWHFMRYNIYQENAKSFEIVCALCSKWQLNNVTAEQFKILHNAYEVPSAPALKQTQTFYVPAGLKTTLGHAIFKTNAFTFMGYHANCATLDAETLYRLLSAKDFPLATAKLQTFKLLAVNLFTLQNDEFVRKFGKLLLKLIMHSLEPPASQQLQLFVLELIGCCVEASTLHEQWIFHFFKMTFFYLLHVESLVAHEAVVCAGEICSKHNVKPIQLWNWYKRDALALIVKLFIYLYINKGIRLTRSLKSLTKMLGFSCVQEFICKYYRLLTTMILPYCVKEAKCKGLIVSISKITRKPIPNIFVVSFLRIYTHIYLTEDADVGNKCIKLFVKCTGSSLSKLMNSDVKQTVAEFLIYFNRNPSFVMKAFQCLLLNENPAPLAASSSTSRSISNNNNSSSSATLQPSEGFAKFIADRFLGVITYFETCLADPIFEKPLKEEALYSLGQIIRFVGADRVTQFRFKIIAMLSFVLSLNDAHLQSICLKVWNIFLHIVNIQELGPSLSRIVASLQPLLVQNAKEVNDIYEFVILKNDSLLGAYISDLYFLEEFENVAPAIRQCVARQTDILKSDKYSLHDKLGFLHKQITNDNLQVRIYGLHHLRQFIAQQRTAVNHIVLNEIRVNPILEYVVDILLAGCRHEDRKLQLASAKCLGELGAIDPSYMPFNFACVQAHDLPLSIHTDDFAIMALTELCRAHQFQKDTKYVDSFSLAIQETLAVCGVSPREKKKLNVWEAIPARLRQVMEPLLNSCYTGSRRESKCKEHPIFGSSYCRSYEDWAFLWASRMIDYVVSEETRHLLHSYKPSIRRDSNTMAIFLPYIGLHALQECKPEEIEQIYEEFTAVFELSKQNFTSSHDFEPTRPKEFRSIKYSADCGGIEGTRSSSAMKFGEQTENFANILRHATKLCSEQIDFLQRWKREWQRYNPAGGNANGPPSRYKRISEFLARFNSLKLAEANYNAGEYTRALMYLEQFIERGPKEQLDAQITFLISIYGKLQDIDSAEGAVYISKSKWKILGELEVSKILDRQQELSTCYETLFQDIEDFQPEHVEGLIDCYLRMDTPQTALFILNGLWQQASENAHYDEYDEVFKKSKFEVLWRLGSYDEMFEMLDDAEVRRKKDCWNTHCAEAFLLFQRSCESKLVNFTVHLEDIRASVLNAMRTTSTVKHNSYPHFYDEVVKLHLLDEIDKCFHLIDILDTQENDDQRLTTMRDFFADWDAKLSVLQPTVRVIEPLLNLRRNLLHRMNDTLQNTPLQELIQMETGKLWLLSAQMNRNAGCLRQAQISIENAEKYAPSTLFIERAKLLWQKGDQTKCFKLLDEHLSIIENKCQRKVRSLDMTERLIYGEAKLLQAAYNAESMNICCEQNLRYFKEAVVANRQSEQANLQLAQYYEKIYASFSEEQKNGENGRKMLIEIMLDYARSLRYGYQNVYQSLPRLLSLWFDYTSQCTAKIEPSTSANSSNAARFTEMQDLCKEMNNLIENCCNVFPTAMFYTTFSQLLSRICHPSNDVYNVLRTIFIKLIEQFPQQSLWMLLPILKSSYTHRIKRCKLIFTDVRLAKPQFQKLLTDFNMLAERLIELTNKDVAMDQTYQLSTLVKQLPKLFEDANFSEILLPFEKYMQASFPITSSFNSLHLGLAAPVTQDALPASSYFPYKQIYISSINEEVSVLRSAAKPKKICIRCSDGKEYAVMVKPKDDLRKDFRLMEFNGLVKRYLHQDPQARYRRLRIRTYAAIPFNEECGLVEWLPNLNSFRGICTGIYRMRGLGMRDGALRQYIVPKTDPIEKKRSVFTDVLLAKHPPIFHEWFHQRFPTPQSWYEARSSYVKTIAVMSMVGYILGLGDRHGENVLFDETNGDAVHVDFNCLFNQGENFAVPELVPFRLTHNMVFAMGPLGVEGMFRKCCEITLRLLKQETNTLMSVLRPFVYDLEALSRNYNKKQTAAELTDPKALNDVRRIEERLQGYVKRTLANSMPLSTEGQVNFLIAEATNIDNLASMYIGWGAYI